MDVREKLVELLGNIYLPMMAGSDTIGEYNIPHNFKREIADYLVSHGVTVQEWVPVTEKLPEDSATVLVCHKNGLVTTNAWLGAHWWFENERNPINHWMPLPEPPKGE